MTSVNYVTYKQVERIVSIDTYQITTHTNIKVNSIHIAHTYSFFSVPQGEA